MDTVGRQKLSLKLVKVLLLPPFLFLCYYLWKDASCYLKLYRKDWMGLLSCSYPLESPELSHRKALILSYELKKQEAERLTKDALRLNNLHLKALLLYASIETSMAIPVLRAVQELFSPYQSAGSLRLSLALLAGDEEIIKVESRNALAVLPNKQDVLALVWLYLGDKMAEVVPKEAKKDYLMFLLSQRDWENALKIWKELPEREQENHRCAVIEAMLSAGRLEDALTVWKDENTKAGSLLNGSFEEDKEACGFGWYIHQYGQGYEISRDNIYAVHGSYSLYINFDGSANPDFNGVYQILPLKNSSLYELTYFVRTRGVSSNSGVYVEITCIKDSRLLITSPQYLGDNEWKQERLTFRTPQGCEGVKLSLRRRPAERLERKIEGSLWLDDFSIRELSHGGHN